MEVAGYHILSFFFRAIVIALNVIFECLNVAIILSSAIHPSCHKLQIQHNVYIGVSSLGTENVCSLLPTLIFINNCGLGVYCPDLYITVSRRYILQWFTKVDSYGLHTMQKCTYMLKHCHFSCCTILFVCCNQQEKEV